ncbi:MAG: starch-binding protein [Brevinematales bacterium]|nr:starch-binding protein [Brevinematales bacterium]
MQNRKMILFLLMIGISFTGCAVSSSSSGGGGGGTGETASLTVYFKKPDSWTGAYIYYWPNGPAWTSSPAMEDVGNNWYRYTIQGRKESWLLFKDKAGDTTTKTPDLYRNRTGWYWTNGNWYDYNPEEPYAWIECETYTFTNKVVVTLRVSGLSATGAYSTNGSDFQVYSDGSTIEVGEGMSVGETCTLVVMGYHTTVTNSNTYILSKGTVEYRTELGVVYTPAGSTFAIWVPGNKTVKLRLDGTDYEMKQTNLPRYPEADPNTIYYVHVPGNHWLKPYNFVVSGFLVRDPYGKMVNGSGQNIVIDPYTNITDPDGGWSPRPPLVNREDAIVYEVHVRDFTIDSSWNGPEEKRGKFLGMVEPGTTYGGYKTGLDHLKEMGVTHVQLMPVYDFYTAQYNWGYDPWNYNVPEDQYSQWSTDPTNRIKEFKTMVNEFHKNGIRVIMDVVYNHTYNKSVFEYISTLYYTLNDLSGCGNSIDAGQPMVSRMIRDSLDYWVSNMNVDGFRFDLIGIFPYDEVRKWGEYLNSKYPDRNLLLYGEPWNGYASDPAENSKVRLGKMPLLASAHVGAFNPKYRERLKGDNDGKAMAYAFGVQPDWTGGIPAGVRGSIMYTKGIYALADNWDSMFAYDPEQSINYISAHDNLCWWDKIRYAGATNGEQGTNINKFGIGIILTSQGIPFLHAGDEFLRTKVLNESSSTDWEKAKNSYNAGDEVNKIRWNLKSVNISVFSYYTNMIWLRRTYPHFRYTTWDEVDTYVKAGLTNDWKVTTNLLIGTPLGQPDLFVVYNAGEDFTVALPSGTWTIIANRNGVANIPGQSGSVLVKKYEVLVLKKQ